ncbi:MAG: glycoside hydrolase family protein [Clostridiales bacterium]|nr:glycoside hydrolase family protein [Clostridiales bacterium]
MSKTTSSAGQALIKSFEGLCLTATKCAAGVWTIGYGHTGTYNGKAVASGMTITKAAAETLLASDLAGFETAVSGYVTVDLTQNQFDALVSFAFNCGKSALKSSTLLKKLNSGDYDGAAEQFLVWNKITQNGVKVESAGLTRRRKAERELFLTGSTSTTTTTTTEEGHDTDTLRNGDTGQQVTVLQKLLNQLGASLSEDGIFGSKTEAAVEQYQTDNGLSVDGICGPKTWGGILAVQ